MAVVLPRGYAAPARRTRALTWPWAYEAESGRDARLDLLRGFCVFAMIVDHIAGSSYAHAVSGAGEYFVSAAEGFVFLSGFVMGMVYRSHAEKHGSAAAVKKALLRSWTLYKLTVVLSILFAAQLTFYKLNFGPFQNWPRFIADIVTMRQTIYLGDIMLNYTMLLAAGAGALWLMRHGKTGWVLASSGALWLAYQIAPGWAVSLPWSIANNTMFHFPAWQLYFIVAQVLGYHRASWTRWLAAAPRLPWFFGAAAVFALMVYLNLTGGAHLPGVLQSEMLRAHVGPLFQKGGAGPLRLVAALFTFQFAFLLVTYLWRPIRQCAGWLLLPLGQNALYTYAVHVLILGALWNGFDKVANDGSLWLNTLAQMAVVLLVWGMVKTRFLFNVIPR